MRPAKNQIGIGGRLRKRNELCHGAKSFVQTVELIAEAACAVRDAGVAVERAVNSAIIGEVEKQCPVQHARIDGMLSGMHFRNITTPVNMREIHEGVGPGIRARREQNIDRALVEIDRARIKIGRHSIGDRRQRQVVTSLHGAAAGRVAAVGNSGVVDRFPRTAAVEALPDALVVITRVHIPDVHLSHVQRAGTIGHH